MLEFLNSQLISSVTDNVNVQLASRPNYDPRALLSGTKNILSKNVITYYHSIIGEERDQLTLCDLQRLVSIATEHDRSSLNSFGSERSETPFPPLHHLDDRDPHHRPGEEEGHRYQGG